MSVLSDLRAARKLIGNAVQSRSTRRELAVNPPAAPAPRSVQVLVYFADTRVNLYQVRQWYAPLAELAATHPVAIMTRSPGATLSIAEESPLPVVYCRAVTDVEQFLAAQDVRIVLYVNQNQKNFQMFRYGRMWHVFINHGESDKMYMTTNQFKAYDYAFVAGDAALDRLRRKLWDFDLEKRAIAIGRPQTDHLTGVLPYTPDERLTVLYAPTWEGDRPAAEYGSVLTHGVALAEALLASPRHRLIYRPHPRSGVVSPEYGEANQRIIRAIAAANAADPRAQHVYDDGPALGWQLAAADVAITDVSAMVYDRLATGKPIVVTRPVSPDAELDLAGYLGSAVWLDASAAGDVVAVVQRALDDPEARATLARWAERHFGDITPGAATARFHAAIERLMGEWERFAAEHADDPDANDVDSDEFDEFDPEGMPARE
ncbi:CDP-glycerol glycerophosphotransferase family protein [Pseudolysinimonas sp.]|uniref:CDP-glycerol glycerophosphotransferase family protein n=1 Tax=Pseudolysinimonas sp. TaxID=2680009 RepID=UPI003F7CE9D8